MSGWERTLIRLADDAGPRLLRTAYLLCGDREGAQDLVQEAFVRCFTRRRSRRDLLHLSGPEQPVTGPGAEAYLRRVMVNILIDEARRWGRWQERKHLLAAGPQEDFAAAAQARVDVAAALSGLSPRQRACVVLRFYHDLTVADIARELTIAEGTVKRHLADGLNRLQEPLSTAGIPREAQ